MEATICMTNVITKPFSIHYKSRDAGMIKLRGISTASHIDNTRLTFEWHPNPVHSTISPDALGSLQSKFAHLFSLMSVWSACNLGLMVHFSHQLTLAKSNMLFIHTGAGLDKGANILSTIWLSLDSILWLIIVSGMLVLLLTESCWMLSFAENHISSVPSVWAKMSLLWFDSRGLGDVDTTDGAVSDPELLAAASSSNVGISDLGVLKISELFSVVLVLWEKTELWRARR